MERAVALQVFESGTIRWTLVPDAVQDVLRMLDEVVLVGGPRASLNEAIPVGIRWSPGEGIAHYDETRDSIELFVDASAGILQLEGVQWAMPEGFVDLLLESVSSVTPTPGPTSTVEPPIHEPTATTIPPSDIFFDHPEGELLWEGPDERVMSVGRGHCEAPDEIRDAFGVPAYVTVEDLGAFWFLRVVPREHDWRWTGYYHDDWQIWQGDSGRDIYIVHARERRISFQYEAYGCI